MQITIARHGCPDLLVRERIESLQMGAWIETYNNAALRSDSVPPDGLKYLVDRAAAVVCSDMRRSIDSASLLNGNKIIMRSVQFREAGLPYGKMGGLRLRPSQWAVVYRCAWLCGFSGHSESFAEARTRAMHAATRLQALADDPGNVVFMGMVSSTG